MQFVKAIVLAGLVGVITAAHEPPARVPPGPEFVTCGCLDGTLLEFCSIDCQDLDALCKESCRGYGNATLFTACQPNGCR